MENLYFECKKCGLKSKQWKGVCPQCGSKDKIILLHEIENFQIHESVTGKDKEPDRKRPKIELQHGEDFSINKNRFLLKKRVIDRSNNIYKELVIDPISDMVIRECKEPLDQYRGHGSDKFKRNKG